MNKLSSKHKSIICWHDIGIDIDIDIELYNFIQPELLVSEFSFSLFVNWTFFEAYISMLSIYNRCGGFVLSIVNTRVKALEY